MSKNTPCLRLALLSSFCLLTVSQSVVAAPLDPPRRVRAFMSSRARSPVIMTVTGQNTLKRKPRSIDKMKWGWTVAVDGIGSVGTTAEPKFAFGDTSGAGRVPAGRLLAGFHEDATGPSETLAHTFGDGFSQFVNGARRPYEVNWDIEAFPDPASDTSSWIARADASDPFHIIADDMIEGGFTGETAVNITFPVGITTAFFEGGDLGIQGEESNVAFDVAMNLNGTSYSLFSMFADFSGVLAPAIDFASMPFDVTIHHLATLDDVLVPGVTDIAISDIGSLLATDFTDGILDTPLLLAFEIRNVLVADIMVGGAILSAEARIRTAGVGAVPTPGATALFCLAGLGLVKRRRK